jgi:hypothetical protein
VSRVYLTDSGTPLITRATSQLAAGTVAGVLLNPFTSPFRPDLSRRGGRFREDAERCTQEITAAGGEVLFDAMTHVLQFPGLNLTACYTPWRLWPGARGDLSSATSRDGHVERVVAAQSRLGVRTLAPTVCLDRPTGGSAIQALDLARRTLDRDSSAWVTIVGTPSFWESGGALDAHVGSMAELRPAGFVVGVVRPALGSPPPGITADEVEGLCRTVYSLTMRCPVIATHADFAGLPAVAAGASGIGSGWFLRQRVLAPDAFRVSTTMRRAASRVTYQGLLAVLKRREAERLSVRDRAMSRRLVPGAVPPTGNPEWEHHLEVLAQTAATIAGRSAGRARARELARLYRASEVEFVAVEPLARPLSAGAAEWIEPLAQGLGNYARAEGW